MSYKVLLKIYYFSQLSSELILGGDGTVAYTEEGRNMSD